MKYGYNSLYRIIEKYYLDDDKIIVQFLDGGNISYELSDENEKCIIRSMLKQAIERNEKTDMIYYKSLNNRNKICCILNWAIPTMFTGVFCLGIEELLFEEFLEALTGSAMFWMVYLYPFIKNKKKFSNFKEEVEELEKYSIYLDMKEELEYVLENSNYHDLFNGVKCSEQVLNINTLDNFSLKDIKKISNNLTGENSKGLVKKKVR